MAAETQQVLASSGKTYDTVTSHGVDVALASPMVKQFLEVKRQHPDALLLYRMGDFYETFLEDAVTAARALELTLTGRDAGKLGKIPMAGVPVRALETYLSRLLAQNFKVAICEQMEDPALAKGLVERQVVRVLSPGTLTESSQLKADENNYLAAIYLPLSTAGTHGLHSKAHQANGCALAYMDVSTGQFVVSPLSYFQLLGELDRLKPAEILVQGQRKRGFNGTGIAEWVAAVPQAIADIYNCTPMQNEAFEPEQAEKTLCRLLKVAHLQGFGLNEQPLLVRAAGALLAYLEQSFIDQLPPIQGVQVLRLDGHVAMTPATRKHMELLANARDGGKEGSLFGVLNKTVTAMGARLLRAWLGSPLATLEPLLQRQNAVELFVHQAGLRQFLRDVLPEVYDMERLGHRLTANTILPRELIALAQSLKQLPAMAQALQGLNLPALQTLQALPESVSSWVLRVQSALLETPAIALKEGGLFRENFNAELDHWRELMNNQEAWLSAYELKLKEETGLKTLKVGFSRGVGYFIELSKGAAAQAPESFQRRQTLTNAERYITQELKQFETEVMEAQGRAMALEFALYTQLRQDLATDAALIHELALQVAQLDVFLALAHVAEAYDYVKPTLDNGHTLALQEARHPVVERQLAMGAFVANDCQLTGFDDSLSNFLNEGLNDTPQILIVTGPNMAGKSTYMRMVALLVLMAQVGSFVPAKAARIGLVDAVYTRIGATDDLAAGQSTFMVEMAETAQILNGATPKSLVILDEVGRGTSTYDGLAIAWSVLAYLVRRLGVRTLFATHYHELNVLEMLYPKRVLNVRVTVSEQENNIRFLHRVEAGSAQKSYGIQVARMAGLPAEVLQLADQKLSELQKEAERHVRHRRASLTGLGVGDTQLTLFE
jgi:DNA mismatch repair protein MutS